MVAEKDVFDLLLHIPLKKRPADSVWSDVSAAPCECLFRSRSTLPTASSRMLNKYGIRNRPNPPKFEVRRELAAIGVKGWEASYILHLTLLKKT